MLPEKKLVSKYYVTTNKKIKPEREWYKIYINGIKTIYSVNIRGNVLNRRTRKVLKPMETCRHYWVYHLMVNGKRIVMMRHRLIACIFIPVPKRYRDLGFAQDFLEVNHVDRDTSNFDIDNLEWLTPEENKLHAKYTEDCKVNKYYIEKTKGQTDEEQKKFRHNTKLTEPQVIEISNALYRGESIPSLAKRYNVSKVTIDNIKFGKSWGDVTKRGNHRKKEEDK